MKRLMLAFALVCSTYSWSQQLQKVYSFSKDNHELPWYQTQQKLWKAEIDKNKKNGEAWINYYRAARAIRYMAPREKGEWNQAIYEKQNTLCKSIVEEVNKAMPNSFEYYVISGAEDQLGKSGDAYLKASKLRPFDPEILDELMIHYDMELDQKNKDLYAKKLFETNDMPVGALNWGYNILSEVDENAILFTYGDNDTYAAWIVQSAKEFRQDVTVLNTYMLQIDAYRNKILKRLGYEPLELKFEGLTTQEETDEAFIKVVEHLAKGKHPIHFVNSNLSFLHGKFDNNLFLVGLSLKFCESTLDNVAIIKRNFEKRYLLDYLTQTFSTNISDGVGIQFNGMYLPAMIKLHQHYKESEDTERKNKLEVLMLRIAEQTDKTEEVKKHIGR